MKGDIRIGPWLVQPRINSIERDGEVRHLEPKVMQVLTTLAAHSGEVVTRDQLRDSVWPDVSVGEDVLIRAVGEIRRAFGDDVRSPHTIQTVPKVGYRLIAPVVDSSAPPSEALPALESLAPFPAHSPVVSAPSSAGRVGKMAQVSIGGLLLIILVIVAIYSSRLRQNQPSSNASSRPLTTYPGQELQPSFSPDGEMIAFVWHKPNEDTSHIYIKSIGSEGPVRLTTGSDDEYSPAWSHDGHTIAFIRQTPTGTWVGMVPATGGERRDLYKLPLDTVWEYGGLTWTNDGESLIFPERLSPAGPSRLVQLSIASHALRPVTNPNAGWDGDWMPNISPDGTQLSFTRGSERSARDLYVMQFPTGSARRLTTDNRLIVGTSWTSDGSAIVFASNREGAMSLWRVTVPDGALERETVGTEDAYGPTVAPKGNRLAYTRGNAEWSIVSRELGKLNGSDSEVLTSSEQDSAPALSPNGRMLAFQSWRSGGQEIWESDAEGKNAMQLTRSGDFAGSPVWSPDGSKIAYDSRVAGFGRISEMGAHGEAQHTFPGGTFDDVVPSWSADGQWLYFGSNRSGSWQIWRMDAHGSGVAQQISVDGGFVAKESGNGTRVYYTRLGQAGLWRRSTQGGAETKVSDSPPEGFQDYWVVSGTEIFLLQSQAGKHEINRLNTETGKSEVIYTFKHDVTPFAGLAVSSDGMRIIHADLTRAESNITLVDNFR